ncbi:MAG TPA: hypothetical protein PLH82_00015 [Candidatus Paceibacterota bacterium]|nr:hypothetical protein [Candidatus Paceibacterota bacterium]
MKITTIIKNYLQQVKPKAIVLKNLHSDLCPGTNYNSFRKVFVRLEKQGIVKVISRGIYEYTHGETYVFNNEYYTDDKRGFLFDDESLKLFNLDGVIKISSTIYSNRVIGNSIKMSDGISIKYYNFDPEIDNEILFKFIYLVDAMNSIFVLEMNKQLFINNFNNDALLKVIKYFDLSRLKRLMFKNWLETNNIKSTIESIIPKVS